MVEKRESRLSDFRRRAAAEPVRTSNRVAQPHGFRESEPDRLDHHANTIKIVGNGQCGSQIAATCLLRPDYLPAGRQNSYPVKAAAFDTHEAMRNILSDHWGWTTDPGNVFIIPMPSPETIASRIKGGIPATDIRYVLFAQELQGGTGGIPFLGRLAAEATLLADDPPVDEPFDLRGVIIKNLRDEDFTSGILLTCNSLTDGTGAGFSPVAARFLREKVGFNASLTFNLSVMPAERESETIYPCSILYNLHDTLTGGFVDNVIVADNDVLASRYTSGRINYRVMNEALRDMLMPVLLAPLGKYGVPYLTSGLDESDIKRWLGRVSDGSPEIAALSCGVMPLKSFLPTRFTSAKKRRGRVEVALQALAEQAAANVTFGDGPLRSEVGGIGVLFGPPALFEKALEMDFGYVDLLTSHLGEVLGNNRIRTVECMSLDTDGLDRVGLILLVSGVSPPKLVAICREALGHEKSVSAWDDSAGLAENIRNLPPQLIEDLMIDEARRSLDI